MRTISRQLITILLTTILTVCIAAPVFANPIIPIPIPQRPTFTPGVPNLDASGFILMDSTSGKILAEKNADVRMPPASLTKLMSLYIISAAIKTGQITLDDKVRISTKAWKTEGSRMFLKVNSEVPVRDLLQGVIVASGNDATVALAEHIAGSEETFTAMMNEEAKLLGMKNSHFMDSTGLPNKDHYSTARDLAILTQAYIQNFPEDYSLYSEKSMTYNGIRQSNRNRLLWRYEYADGLKTGHTEEAGYCLVASAKKDGMRLISIVLGEPSDNNRTEDSIRLLTYGFRFFETKKLYNANSMLVQARVWQGQQTSTPLGITGDMYVTAPTGQSKKLQANIVLNNPLKAPLVKGQRYGTLNIVLNGETLASQPLVALENNPKGSFWRRTVDSVKLGFGSLLSSPGNTDDKVNTG